MSWSDEDDPFENEISKKTHRKPRRNFDRVEENEAGPDEGDAEYVRKRAGKRSHRKKTHKDEFWEDKQR